MAFDFTGLIKTGIESILGPLLDRIPDPNERARAKEAAESQIISVMSGLIQGQLEINKAEAQHHSVFVAGWRPFIGWVLGVGFAYSFIVHPILQWVVVTSPTIGLTVDQLPTLDTGELVSLTLGMLGLGGLRTYEKRVGVDTKKVKEKD